MKVLMFGWEFPPFSMGGLGTACYGLTKGLSKNKVQVLFVIPNAEYESRSEYVNLQSAEKLVPELKIKRINSLIIPYITNEEYLQVKKGQKKGIYGDNLFNEVKLYAERAKKIVEQENFDIIHAHDWMTYPAAIEAKKITGKKLILHVHATEYDRTGDLGGNSEVHKIEKEGLEFADKIIAVSQFTKNKIIKKYGIPENKIKVVHNAVDFDVEETTPFKISKDEKVVLFLGRITLQKGPDYFVEAAKKVLEKDSKVKFIIAGSGDMELQIVQKVAALGLGDKILFSGYLRGKDVDRAYKLADLYVMPSVSEPFGITPLEALRNNIPVIISKQSGVSEVLTHALKVDFWDINELTNKILSVLKYRALRNELTKHGTKELRKFSWEKQALLCKQIYEEALA